MYLASLWLLALFPTAHAQSGAALIDGDSTLSACLDSEDCGPWLTETLSENMVEYGLTLQHDPMATSAITGKGVGFVVETRFDTLTLGPRNEVTKSIPLPPVVPRLGVGYQLGSYTFDDPYPQFAIGAFTLPPIRVFGASVFSAGIEGSMAVPVTRDGRLWVGAEVDYGYTRIAAHLVGTAQQLTRLEQYINANDIEGDCSNSNRDCVDTYTQHAPGARFGLSVDPVPALFFFGKAGVSYVSNVLFVDYDDTRWGLTGFQPQGHLGMGLRAGDRYQITGSTVFAAQPPHLATDDAGFMSKIALSMSFRFGDARYWDRKQAVEPPETDPPPAAAPPPPSAEPMPWSDR